jgi:hypothetical protein
MDYNYYIKKIKERGELFESGLTESEFKSIESEFCFKFPPDLKEFLSVALPVSGDWVNWRDENRDRIKERINWPYEGICFDIENNLFWLDAWGKKPNSLQQCFEIAKCAINKAPKLIPVYSHRYIPESPPEKGNPIFSVYQTDIIYYGANLENYFKTEFWASFGEKDPGGVGKIKRIEFWSELVEKNC